MLFSPMMFSLKSRRSLFIIILCFGGSHELRRHTRVCWMRSLGLILLYYELLYKHRPARCCILMMTDRLPSPSNKIRVDHLSITYFHVEEFTKDRYCQWRLFACFDRVESTSTVAGKVEEVCMYVQKGRALKVNNIDES